jgi:hypothetical protein
VRSAREDIGMAAYCLRAAHMQEDSDDAEIGYILVAEFFWMVRKTLIGKKK